MHAMGTTAVLGTLERAAVDPACFPTWSGWKASC